VFGYLGSIGGLLQYTIVQGHTPDHMLGRIGSFWTAQDVVGDSAGALGIGVIVKVLSPVMGLIALGFGCATVTVLLSAGVRSLRSVSLIDTTLFPDDDVAEKETLQAKDATA
jgi:ENTS family enterobactin (siderophore) exporter